MCAEGTHFKTQSDCEVILHLVRVVHFFSWNCLDPFVN
jgi:asparagine synthetase B (glutamine-hydrolysing)